MEVRLPCHVVAPDRANVEAPDLPPWMKLNLQGFRAALGELIGQAPGQFALVRDGMVVRIFADRTDGLRWAYAQFPDRRQFLLKVIAREPQSEASMYDATPECLS